jgi:hypothetical protein
MTNDRNVELLCERGSRVVGHICPRLRYGFCFAVGVIEWVVRTDWGGEYLFLYWVG